MTSWDDSRVLTDGRLIHGWFVQGLFFFKKGLISEMVSCGALARAGPIRAHMGPYGPKRALYEPTICGPTM